MYTRSIKYTWNEDSISDTEYAVTCMTGLARELTQLKMATSNTSYEHEYNGEWTFPAELQDQWEWLDFAIERIEKLGHNVDFDEQGGKFEIILIGKNFPLLLGYDSQAWLSTNLKNEPAHSK